MRFYAFFHYKPTTNTKVKDGKKNRMTMETPIEVYLKSAEILAPLCHLPRPAQTFPGCAEKVPPAAGRIQHLSTKKGGTCP